MDSGFYSSFSALAARMDALDLLANNLANVNTTGFKSNHEFYRSLSMDLSSQASLIPTSSFSRVLNESINRFGLLGGSDLDLSQGTLENTGNDTDVALEGSGWFSVLTKNGVRYTRDGSFILSKERNLITKNGDIVLSEQGGSNNVPIQVPSGKITISPDGTLSVDGSLVAKLRIEDFPQGTQLTPEGNAYLNAPVNVSKPAAATVR